MTADELTDRLVPVASNPLAAVALMRLAYADDPDAMAEQIRAEWQPMFDHAHPGGDASHSLRLRRRRPQLSG